MILVNPTPDELNAAFHVQVMHRADEFPVPDYIAGEDRDAVYGYAHTLGDLPLDIKGDAKPDEEWYTWTIKLGSKPWVGTGRTLLEAWVHVLVVASGVEVVR